MEHFVGIRTGACESYVSVINYDCIQWIINNELDRENVMLSFQQ